jgi:hypothetical protein
LLTEENRDSVCGRRSSTEDNNNHQRLAIAYGALLLETHSVRYGWRVCTCLIITGTIVAFAR